MRHRGRGRPRENRDENDLGTKELQQKRAANQTEEPLDRYYRLELISEQQYWCGNHFRWLYAMRYGVPGVRAVDPSLIRGRECIQQDDQWLEKLNHEYMQVSSLLEKNGLLSAIMNVAVYSQFADGITPRRDLINKLSPALDILVDLWC